MPPDLATMTRRVASLRVEVRDRAPGEALLAQVEDVLTEGYAHALTGDAWSMQTEQRMHDLIGDASSPVRGGELRALATEHARFQRDVVGLRRELVELRHERDRLRAGAGAGADSHASA